MIFEFNFNKSINFKREKHNPIKRITIDLTNNQENKELNTEKKKDFYIIQHYHLLAFVCFIIQSKKIFFFLKFFLLIFLNMALL
jgi:hypothetical protein